MRAVRDPEARAALGLVTAGLERLSAAGVSPIDSADAVAWIEAIEGVHRRVARNLNAGDGHFSAKRMVEHHAGLSPTDANRRDCNRRMLAELGDVAEAFSSQRLGIGHATTLAKVFANTRVREHMAPAQQWFLDQASSLSFRDFDQVVREWERLVDADGAADRNQRNHEARNATLVQDPFDLGWELRARTASMVGAELAAVLDAYTCAEYEADWEKARAEHGDRAAAADLPRTAAQRRHDALAQIFHDAANSNVGSVSVPTHNIVWSAETYEEVATALETGTTPRLDVATHRCSTLTGVPVEPVEAMVAGLWARVRRVVVDAGRVTIDLGTARFFTGSARHAVLVTNPRCIWPGCHTPADACQVDHLHEHQSGGRTSPGNGAPLCGRHNRHKHNHRYRIQREPNGQYTVMRPDGTLVA